MLYSTSPVVCMLAEAVEVHVHQPAADLVVVQHAASVVNCRAPALFKAVENYVTDTVKCYC